MLHQSAAASVGPPTRELSRATGLGLSERAQSLAPAVGWPFAYVEQTFGFSSLARRRRRRRSPTKPIRSGKFAARARAKVNSISATLLCAQFNIRHPNDDDDDVNSLRPIHMSGLPFGRTFCARAHSLSLRLAADASRRDHWRRHSSGAVERVGAPLVSVARGASPLEQRSPGFARRRPSEWLGARARVVRNIVRTAHDSRARSLGQRASERTSARN